MPRPRRPRLSRSGIVTVPEWNAYVEASMSEHVWQEHVRQAFIWTGWDLYYHTWISIHSPKGFVDVSAARYAPRFRVLFAELKRVGEEPTEEQNRWLDALGRIGPPVEVYVWTPADRDEMLAILQAS